MKTKALALILQKAAVFRSAISEGGYLLVEKQHELTLNEIDNVFMSAVEVISAIERLAIEALSAIED